MASFATRLRELRKSRNLRKVDLAQELGVAQTTIANYEQDARFPDEEALGRIAGFFDISLDYLLGRTDVSLPVTKVLASDHGADVAALSPLAQNYLDSLITGKKEQAFTLITDALKDGVTVESIYMDVFQPCLVEMGRRWETNEVDISQEHYFSAATEMLMSQISPFLKKSAPKDRSVVMAVVSGELHEIGARMVADFLEGSGWNCYYLGVNIPTANIIRAIEYYSPDLLAISATMSIGIDAANNLIQYIRNWETQSRRSPIRVITGGKAFSLDPELWKRIGADGYASSADEAVKLADSLVNESYSYSNS